MLSSFPSLPLTERGHSHCWATSTFEGFYCCGEEAIAMNKCWWPCQRQAGETQAYRWWEEVWEDEKQLEDQRVRVSLDDCSLLTSPVCLFLFSCPVSCPVLLTWSMAQARAGLPGLGSLCSHWRWTLFLSSLLVGRWRVSWSSPQGHGDTFFPQICTRLACFFSCMR